MFTVTSKIRTVVALGAVGGVLASAGVASAAMVSPSPGTVAPAPSKVVAKYINPNNVGSATKGMTNKDCENLANAVNGLNLAANQQSDPNMASYYATEAAHTEDTLDSLCFVID